MANALLDVFVICMKSAISGITEAVSSNDRNVRSAAVEAISALARRGMIEMFSCEHSW